MDVSCYRIDSDMRPSHGRWRPFWLETQARRAPRRWRCHGLAFALLCSVVGGAQAAADASPAATAQAGADAALASDAWRQFVATVQANARDPVDVADLARRCRAALAHRAPASGTEATETCLQAAAQGLGRDARYVPALEAKAGSDPQAQQALAGIGLELQQPRPGGSVDIVSAFEGAPAARAGLRAGDRLLAIDGAPAARMSTAEVVRLLRGEAGSVVRLTVQRSGEAEAREVAVTRAPIRRTTVQAGWLAPGLAYARIAQFGEGTRDELLGQLDALAREPGREPPARLVLDLRQNPGGLVATTVGLAALFVRPHAEVLRIMERKSGKSGETVYRAEAAEFPGGLRLPAPDRAPLAPQGLAVLVDSRPAAGAEALAQVLRERRRAPLVGAATAGLGSIATALPLPGGAIVLVPTGEMRSPLGHAWEGRGLMPDLPVAPEQPAAAFGRLPADEALARALAWLR